ncbi:MAG: nucleotidyltransferase domain-containing protein [Gloeomargaritaceae cyanobacterium C42_A2020_066]|nr:nucleotidyltransferase domain-containing protein [Gloeomargaritaceae cyanobacterium C42_A2020_066]
MSIEKIQLFSQQIAERFQPERIILFGSYAYGNPNDDSDVDLLVILPFEEMPVQKAISIRQQIKAPFPLDLMARTPQQVQHRLEMGDLFIQDIISNGRVLYAANHVEANYPRMDQ